MMVLQKNQHQREVSAALKNDLRNDVNLPVKEIWNKLGVKAQMRAARRR